MLEIEKLKKENFELKKQIKELQLKLDELSSFRGEKQKLGMIKQASHGNHMSRIPFGYKWENRKLIPAINYREVEEIYEEFLQEDMNLAKLARKHNFSVNGLKKILKNFIYIGKIKFDGQIHNGSHKQIISSILFNKVQDKLEREKKKKGHLHI